MTYVFKTNKSGQFFLENKGAKIVVTPEEEYVHCELKVKGLGENIYSGFASNNKQYIVKSAVNDFVYMRKENAFLQGLHEYMQNGGIIHFDGEEVPEEVLIVPVARLDLSTRPHNALVRNKIYMIDDIPRTKKALKKLDGMGEKSANEILDKLKTLGLVAAKKKKRKTATKSKPKPKPKPKPKLKSEKTKLEDSQVPSYICAILEDNGINFLEDIPKSIKELLKIDGLGRAKIKKLMATTPFEYSVR